MQKKAVVLFSGGLDSTTCLAIAKSQRFDCYALSFHYGQKHVAEIEHAKLLADEFGVVEHRILTLPIGELGGSSLTDAALDVPDYQQGDAIPNTYVPARNTIFLSFALSYGEVVGAYDIFIGANIMDYSQYPDCRPEFLHAFETLAKVATKAGTSETEFHIHAPLLKMTKADIIKTGIALGIDYSKTISCYRADKDGRACGNCDSCTYRKKGFTEAGITDQTRYM